MPLQPTLPLVHDGLEGLPLVWIKIREIEVCRDLPARVALWGEVAGRVVVKLTKGGAALPKRGSIHVNPSSFCLQFPNYPCIPEMPLIKPSPNSSFGCWFIAPVVYKVDVVKA